MRLILQLPFLQIKMVEVLGLPTGEMRGDYFEMAVFNDITTAGRIKFEYTSCAKTSTVELISPKLQKETLHVAHVPEIKKEVNACYHVPHMKGGDIILVYGKKYILFHVLWPHMIMC